jgi:hypothetical protein
MKKKDVIIATWEYGKAKSTFRIEDLQKYLKEENYTLNEINLSTHLIKKSFTGDPNIEIYTIDPASYVSLLNYNEVQLAKRSVKIARWSIWIAIITSLASIAFEFVDIEPVKKINFWNIKIEEKQK